MKVEMFTTKKKKKKKCYEDFFGRFTRPIRQVREPIPFKFIYLKNIPKLQFLNVAQLMIHVKVCLVELHCTLNLPDVLLNCPIPYDPFRDTSKCVVDWIRRFIFIQKICLLTKITRHHTPYAFLI